MVKHFKNNSRSKMSFSWEFPDFSKQVQAGWSVQNWQSILSLVFPQESFSPPPAQAGLFGSIKHDHLTNDWINILSCGFCFLLLIAFFIPILHFGPHHEVFPQSTPLLFSLYFNLQWIFFRNEFNSYLHTSYTSWVGGVYAFKSSL